MSVAPSQSGEGEGAGVNSELITIPNMLQALHNQVVCVEDGRITMHGKLSCNSRGEEKHTVTQNELVSQFAVCQFTTEDVKEIAVNEHNSHICIRMKGENE